jgi:hypothetical protein
MDVLTIALHDFIHLVFYVFEENCVKQSRSQLNTIVFFSFEIHITVPGRQGRQKMIPPKNVE